MLTRNVQPFPEVTQRTAHRWWALAAVECGNFVVYMDGFIVTLALPTLARHFGVALSVLKWVIVAYLLAVTVTLLPAGRLADLWGRKRIVVVGLTVLAGSAVRAGTDHRGADCLPRPPGNRRPHCRPPAGTPKLCSAKVLL